MRCPGPPARKENNVEVFRQPIQMFLPTQVAPNSRLSARLPPHRASIARRFSDCLPVRRLELGDVEGVRDLQRGVRDFKEVICP